MYNGIHLPGFSSFPNHGSTHLSCDIIQRRPSFQQQETEDWDQNRRAPCPSGFDLVHFNGVVIVISSSFAKLVKLELLRNKFFLHKCPIILARLVNITYIN